MAAALVIFVLTYLAIAAGRVPWLSIDRPAAALLGAVMMVAVAGLLQLLFRRELPRRRLLRSAVPSPALDAPLLRRALAAMAKAVAGFLAGFPLAWTRPFRRGPLSAAASQVVSNVPFVILATHWIPRTTDPELLWLSTALCSTLAGNLTVVGSVANLIVLESAGPKGRVGFWRFLRYGAVVTGATLAISLGLLLAEHRSGVLVA